MSRGVADFRTIAGHSVIAVDVHLTGELTAVIAAVAVAGVAVVALFGAIGIEEAVTAVGLRAGSIEADARGAIEHAGGPVVDRSSLSAHPEDA
jgi:hypothetical protein